MSFKLLLRTFSFILISAFIWSQVGPVAVLCSRAIHYREIHAILDADNNSDTLIVGKNALQDVVWIEKDEIRYHGHMFDVAGQIDSKEEVLFIGHFDQKDDDLFSTLCTFLEYGTEDQNTDDVPVMLLEFDAILYDQQSGVIACVFEPGTDAPLFSSSHYRYSEKETLFQPPKAS